MIRWVTQRDEHSCGPVALLNLHKWAGVRATYHTHMPRLRALCRCTRVGTHVDVFDAALRSFNWLNVVRLGYPSVADVSETENCCGVVVLHAADHYFLVTDQTVKSFYCVNLHGCGWVAKSVIESQYIARRPTAWCVTLG